MFASKTFAGTLLFFLTCGAFGVAEDTNPKADLNDTSAITTAPTHATFELPDTEGQLIGIPANAPAKLTVLCFLGAECPLANLYAPRLEALSQSFPTKDVRILGIGSNRQDSPEDLKAFIKKHAVTFPLLKDHDNKAADHFQATRTPEVIVLDAEGTIRYRGRIDDQYEPGIHRAKPLRNDLEEAINELLSDKTVSVPKTEPTGCLIGKIPKASTPTNVTYGKEVSRILDAHCVECHQPGEIGPFSLTDYEEVIGWGETLLEVIDQGRMPPWHASSNHRQIANARHMPTEDKETLRKWVAGGMPFGSAQDLPKLERKIKGWQLPKEPEQVVSMSQSPFDIPAEGVVDYQYFVVDPKFTEDKWITAAQVIPGNPAVVHHCIVFVRPPDESDFRSAGWLTGYVPGQRMEMLPMGYARKVPAGSRLVFQMHYTPNGTKQTDNTKIGLLFGKDSDITHEVNTLTVLNQDFEIPPHHASYPVSAGVSRFPAEGEILAITPHMHYRGKSIQVFAERGEDTEVLLDVPRYDFNWQHIYGLAQPIPLADITRLKFTAQFDNSDQNPFNPDPTEHITWGDQTWEEMAITFFEIATPRSGKTERPRKNQKSTTRSSEQQQKVDDFVSRFFERFDANKDGVILKTEMPVAQQRYGFDQFDRDNNGELDREEIQAHAKEREF